MSFELLNLPVKIDDWIFSSMIDTGAMVSFISLKLVEERGLSSSIDKRYAGNIKGIGSSRTLGMIKNFPLCILDPQRPTDVSRRIFIPHNINVMESSDFQIILGIDFLTVTDASVKVKSRSIIIQDKIYRALSSVESDFLKSPIRYSRWLCCSVAPLIYMMNSDSIKNMLRIILRDIIKYPTEEKYRSVQLSSLPSESQEIFIKLGFEINEKSLTYKNSDVEIFKDVMMII